MSLEDKNRRIFGKRSRLTRDLTCSFLRSVLALRRNWDLHHQNYLLPRAETIFDHIESQIREAYSIRRELGAEDWNEIREDEQLLQCEIQNITAILNWVYWQRLEGYEIADVSAIRECTFEDIGGIQQLFIAADALIEDYRSAFNFQISVDILSVFGLYEELQVPFPFFISAPRYDKYGFLPSWLLFSHEIAHIVIDWIDNKVFSWIELENQRKKKMDLEHRIRKLQKTASERGDESSELQAELEKLKVELAERKGDLNDVQLSLKRIFKQDFFKNLEGNSDYGKLRLFFKNWQKIREKALAIVELMLRLTSGTTGLGPEYCSTYERLAEQLICDIIATLLSGEYYIYSLCFYRFFPSLVRHGDKLYWPVREPYILRFFVCLETLIHTAPELTKAFDLLSNIHLPLTSSHKSFGCALVEYMEENDLLDRKQFGNSPFIGLLKEFDVRGIFTELLRNHDLKQEKQEYYKFYLEQKEMMKKLLEVLLFEENSIKDLYLQVREGGWREDEYHYFGSVMQEELRLVLRDGSPKLGKFEEIPKNGQNSLKELVELLQKFVIKHPFYDKDADFCEIGKIARLSEELRSGVLVFPSKPGKPRDLMSAFCYLYFKEKLADGKVKFEFSEAFNATVLSIAWSIEALKRFSNQ